MRPLPTITRRTILTVLFCLILFSFSAPPVFAVDPNPFSDKPYHVPYTIPAQVLPNQTQGAFVYDIALTVPPGRNNLTPVLKLTYNNYSASPFDQFGYGWSISIPYVERLNRTGTEDMYTDSYFLSSQDGEIVLQTGTTTAYGAKVDSGDFKKYTYVGGVWTVTDKRGMVYKYGSAAGSRQDDPADPSRVFRWMLSEIRDPNGNYITYTYYKESGQIYPSTITYTHNGGASGIFEVAFTRESRPDIATSTAEGFAAVTKYRISEIQAKVNGTWVKKFAFAYTLGNNAKRSLLDTVTETGRSEDGSGSVSLPAIDASYSTSTKAWTNNMGYATSTLPVFKDGNYDNGLRLVDVNGDSLPDLLRSYQYGVPGGGTTTIEYRKLYLNDGDGTGWTQVADSAWASTTVPFFSCNDVACDQGARLADFNGDGYVDIMVTRESSSVDTRKLYFNDGTGKTWVEQTDWASTTVPLFAKDGKDHGTRILDVNGDSFPDLLQSMESGNPQVITKNLVLNGGDGKSWYRVPDSDWASTTIPTFFEGVSQIEYGVRVADLNGDGLDDIIQSYAAPVPQDYTKKRLLLNAGDGKNWTEVFEWASTTIPEFSNNGYDIGVRLFDANGDRLPDIMQSYETTGGSGSLTRNLYLNQGDGKNWVRLPDTDWASTTIPVFTKTTNVTEEQGVRPSDINGDGVVDFVQMHAGSSFVEQKIFTGNGELPDFPQSIRDAKGKITRVLFKGSSEYLVSGAPANPDLPFNLQTVVESAVLDDFNSVATTTYAYSAGDYYFSTSTDRRFAGFGKIVETDPFGDYTNKFFHQGNATSTSEGEAYDDPAKIGRVYKEERYGSGGSLYSRAFSRWQNYDLGNGRDFIGKIGQTSLAYDGDSDHRDVALEWAFNTANGNLTSHVEWGEVTASTTAYDFSDSGSDKRTTSISYASKSGTEMGFPSSQTIYDQDGTTKVKEDKYYYDSLAHGSVDKGNETKHERWVTGGTYIDTEKTFNSYGLVTQEKDPRDKATNYTYESNNLYVASSTNPLSQTTAFSYDLSSGKAATTTDPNTRVFVTVFDGLDRVKERKEPDQTTPATLVTMGLIEYTDTVGSRRVKETKYLNAATSTDIYTYLDGFDRPLQVRLEAESAGIFSVSDKTYDALGRLKKESLPYFSGGSARGSATSDQTLYATRSYDPLSRVTSIVDSVGTTTYAYDQWETIVTDGNGKPKDLHTDAYGNLATVEEHNSAETYTTSYQYDKNNNLTRITDALSNLRNFTYDGLSRLTKSEDLHASGDTGFASTTLYYDASGNVTSRYTDQFGGTTFTYDDTNRPLTENYTTGAGTEIEYAYDSCEEGKGHLCAATTTDAVTNFAYYGNGRMKSEARTIGGSSYTTTYSHDRQGNPIFITYPDNSQVKYNYNAAGLLEQIGQKESGGSLSALVSNFDYGPTGAVTLKQFANGVDTTYTYDATKRYRLTNIKSQTGGTGGSIELAAATGAFSHFAAAERALESFLALVTGDLGLDSAASSTPDVLLPEPLPETAEPIPALAPTAEPDLRDVLGASTSTELTADSSEAPATTSPATASTTEETATPKDIAASEIPAPEVAGTAPAAPAVSADESAPEVVAERSEEPSGEKPKGTPHIFYPSQTEAASTTIAQNSSDESLIAFEHDGLLLKLDLPGEKKTRAVHGQKKDKKDGHNATVFENALGEGMGLEIGEFAGGVRKEVVIADKAALGAPSGEHVELPFEVRANKAVSIKVGNTPLGDGETLITDELVSLTSEEGATSYIQPAWADDAEGNPVNIGLRLELRDNVLHVTKLIPVSWLETAIYPVRTDLTLTVYSHSADGYVERDMHESWSTTRGHSEGQRFHTLTYINLQSGLDYYISRAFLTFDTSSVPDGATVSSAKLWIRPYLKWNNDNDGKDFITVIQSNQQSATTLSGEDYNDCGSLNNPTEGINTSERKDITSISTSTYLSLTLNSTGIGWIDKTGYTKLCMREGHDVLDEQPDSDNYVRFYTQENGTSTQPYLEIVYNTTPTAPSDLLAEGAVNPVNVTDSTPEMNAIFHDPDPLDSAIYYQLQVSTTSDFTATQWDSGKTAMATTSAESRSPDISYAGSALASSTTYYWRLKFWDTEDSASPWSTATSTFSLAGGSGAAGSMIQNISFTYDAVGNILTQTDTSDTGAGKAVTYTYDDLNRLLTASTTAASSTPYSRTYTYSAIGNTASSSDLGAYTYGGTGMTNPHGATAIGAANYSYDNNGNMTAAGSISYTWDWRNRLTQSGGAATTTYGYDHDNLRVFKKVGTNATTTFSNMYFNKQSATTTKHVFAPDGTLIATVEGNGSATSTRYIHPDHLGGTNAVTDSSATVVETTDYYPYGGQRIHTGSFTEQRKFTGHEYDSESDLTYAKARYYEQDIGRFLSQDSVFQNLATDKRKEAALANPQLQQAYGYAANNPIKNTDTEGEFLDTIADIGFIAYDAYRLGNALINSGDVKTELAALGADIIGALIPFGTGFGLGVRAVDKVGDVRQAIEAGREAQAKLGFPNVKSGSAGGESAGKRFSESTKAQAHSDAGGKCVFCGLPTTDRPGPLKTHIDHSTSRVQGGNALPANAQNTCQTCNLQKGAQTSSEFIRNVSNKEPY